jgi:DnaK suppressor protein
MIVSILQLMGLAFGKSIQSRPGPEAPSGAQDKPSKVDNKGTNRREGDRVAPDQRQPAGAHSEAAPAGASRRQEVKTQTAKPAAQAKTQAPAESPGKAEKSAARAPLKTAAPTPATVKKTAAAKAKPAPVKSPAPASRPATAKPAAKPAMKSPAKTVQQDPQPTLKPVAGVVPAKTPARAKMPDANAVKTAEPALTAAKRTVAAPAAPVPAPAKAGRPSRLSQITVPSMAQAVASTAAKASYTNTMSTPVLTQPTYTPAKKDPKLANNWKSKPADQLTDAEVLAMPEDEYMNDKQMAFFRLKLMLLKQGILSNAGETTEHLRADTVVVPDPADRATIEEEHALELRTRDRERKLLKKIEQSIIRIDAGDYGYCDETGEPIGVGRLLARPTATLSLEAQQRRELKQKMFGD